MEEYKTIGFLFADLILIAAGTIYGWKFLKKRNFLLGLECWIVAISATNLLFSALLASIPSYEGISSFLYGNALYLDAFSRASGFPLIAIAGLMAVTHAYQPSKFADILWFAGSFAAAGILIVVAPEHRHLLGQFGESALVDTIETAKPWFYLVMWSFCSCFLTYFAWRLIQVREHFHAWSIITAMVAAQIIATIYDFFHIPGDDAERTLFYTAALSAWAFLTVALYYAYCALERNQQKYTAK
jgi:hypothetical protein